MSNAQSMGSGRGNSGGTIVGFKITLLSLVGLMVATPILQWDILVYFMVLFPAGGGILAGIITGSVSAAGGVNVPRWMLITTAVVIDVVAIVSAYVFYGTQLPSFGIL